MARTPKKLTKPKVRKPSEAPKANAANGYESTRYNGRRSFLLLSPAQDQKRDLTYGARIEMLRKMRWGERNSGPIRAMVGDLVLYTVGDGFTAQPETPDASWNSLAYSYWVDATKRLDITGRFSFNELLRIAERRWVVDGDFFLAKVRNGSALQSCKASKPTA